MSATAHDLSGLHGLHSTNWTNVKKVLHLLGGNKHRGTTHTTLYKMPSGKTIAVGKDKNAKDQIGYDAIKQLLDEVTKAEIDVLLFLAMLDRIGCAWNRRPAAVSRLAKWMRSEQPNVRTPALQRAALKAFSAAQSPPEEAAASTKPIDAPAAPTPVTRHERDKAEAKKAAPDPGKHGTGSDTYTWTVPDVLDLTGLDGEVRLKASTYLSSSMNSRSGVPGRMIRERHAARLPRPKGVKGGGKLNAFTERGAMTVAQELVRRYGTPEQQAKVETPKPPRGPRAKPPVSTPAVSPPKAAPPKLVGKSKPATIRVNANGLTSRSASDAATAHATGSKAESSTTAAPAARNGEAKRLQGGPALLVLCEHHDVEPAWDEFTLDVPATIARLAQAAAGR